MHACRGGCGRGDRRLMSARHLASISVSSCMHRPELVEAPGFAVGRERERGSAEGEPLSCAAGALTQRGGGSEGQKAREGRYRAFRK